MSQEEVTVIDLSKKTLAELKEDCKERGLKVSGKKADLIERLEEYMTKNEGAEIEEDDLLEEPDVSLEEETKENVEEEKVDDADQLEINAEPTEDDMTKKKLSRAERFGIESKEVIDNKKDQRAARFGLNANGAGDKSEADDKKRARAERFGTQNGSNKKSKLEGVDITVDPEKLKKRQERFGVTVETDKKKARAARFGKM